MKFNFWQILGVLLIVVGVIFVIRKQRVSTSAPVTNTPVITVPSTQPIAP